MNDSFYYLFSAKPVYDYLTGALPHYRIEHNGDETFIANTIRISKPQNPATDRRYIDVAEIHYNRTYLLRFLPSATIDDIREISEILNQKFPVKIKGAECT